MADFQHREGSGTLFPNKKRDSDKSPNARGDALIGGVLYEIAAWTKRDKNGNPWQSLAIKPKEPRPQAEPVWGGDLPRVTAPSTGADFDDIPF